MGFKVAERGLVPPFIAMEVMREASACEKKGANVIHLEVGQPSTAAPPKVLEACKRALDVNVMGYTVALGIDPLRQRIAENYKEWYGKTVKPENVVVSTGSSGAFLLAFLSAFEPGDKVAVASPGYPAYRNTLRALGVEPVLLPVDASTRFQPTVEMLDAAGVDFAGVIVASPSNPAGTMVTPEQLRALSQWCVKHGARLVSDEIYHGITYNMQVDSAVGLEGAIIINSFSKYYSMTGWRLGWLVLPDELLRPVERLAQNLFISAPAPSQFAAVAAFDCREELEANVARYARNRAVLLEELPKVGFDKFAPADGAFYLYADVSRYTDDSEAFCRRMLNEVGIACTPGTDFDPIDGRHFLRFSFAGSTAEMVEAARRLKDWRK